MNENFHLDETPEGLFTNSMVPSSLFAKPDPKPATPWESIGWLLFTVLLFCSPPLIWAVWAWVL